MEKLKLQGVEPRIAVVAFGGNAVDPTGKSSANEMWKHVQDACKSVLTLLNEGYRVILTHGNGPQIGRLLIRMNETKNLFPPMPMDICVADTQAAIGYMIQQSLANLINEVGRNHPIATVITQVEVDPDDPAFENPTKPIGPFYEEDEAKSVSGEKGWQIAPDSNRGYRRVVPSPYPIKILELPAIRKLVSEGIIVITVGGGGIPVVKREGRYVGIDAVIDKDFSSALLAANLNAHTFIILTGVDQVAINFGKPTERPLSQLDTKEAKAYLDEGQFPVGSMGPKIEAAIKFLNGHNDGEVLITSLEALPQAIRGRTGTRILP